MYTNNYQNYPTSYSSYQPYNHMMYQTNDTMQYSNKNGDRFVGGFAFPFLLGGVTGAALAPAFWRPRPAYYPGPYYPAPMPYYYRGCC